MKIMIELTNKNGKIVAISKSNSPEDPDEFLNQEAINSGSETVREELDKLISALEEDGTCNQMESF